MKSKDILIGLCNADEKFVNEAQAFKPSKKFNFALPLAASFAVMLLTLAIYGLSDAPPLITHNVSSLPSASNSTNGLDNTKPAPKLNYGSAEMISASRIAIKGHFWHDLTNEQIQSTLPLISQKYNIEGKVHYSSADGIAKLYEINALFNVNEIFKGEIKISPDEIAKDYIISGTPVISYINHIAVEAGLFVTDKNSKGEQNYIYYADFKLDGLSYYMEFASENQKADEAFAALVSDVINGGSADLALFNNPAVPKIIDEKLTQEQAYSEPDFGKYLFTVPKEYLFNNAYRLLNQSSNMLYASWSHGHEDISIQVYSHDDYSKQRMVNKEDTQLYDMSLYPIPWGETMPLDKAHIIENPVFDAKALTLDMIKLREYTRRENTDKSGNSLCMNFSVLYNDVVVEIRSEGVSAEYLFDKLTALSADLTK